MITEIEKKIEERRLTLKDVDGLLLDISWLEHPEIIRKLLDYKKLPQESLTSVVKTDAEIKAEWKTEKLPDGTLRLANYKGSDTIVIIPEKIGKATVSEIGAFALSVNKSPLKKEMRESRAKIKEVRIPSTIVTIGESAFEACENLEKVVLPNEIIELPNAIFANCVNLLDVNLPERLTAIGRFAFCNCKKLATLAIPETVNSIAESQKYWRCGSFEECKKLVLQVKSGSYAEQYAENNGISYYAE